MWKIKIFFDLHEVFLVTYNKLNLYSDWSKHFYPGWSHFTHVQLYNSLYYTHFLCGVLIMYYIFIYWVNTQISFGHHEKNFTIKCSYYNNLNYSFQFNTKLPKFPGCHTISFLYSVSHLTRKLSQTDWKRTSQNAYEAEGLGFESQYLNNFKYNSEQCSISQRSNEIYIFQF